MFIQNILNEKINSALLESFSLVIGSPFSTSQKQVLFCVP